MNDFFVSEIKNENKNTIQFKNKYKKKKILAPITFALNCNDGKAFYNEFISKKANEFIEDCYNGNYSYDQIKYILKRDLLSYI